MPSAIDFQPVSAFLRASRSAAERLRSTLRGIVHTVRRRRAARTVRSLPKTAPILFICQGNQCRSPFAEAVLNRPEMLHERNRRRIGSAGFVAPGQPAPEHARRVGARKGVDLGEHESRLITLGELNPPSLPVVMEPSQRDTIAVISGRPRREILVLGDLDPLPDQPRSVKDPFRQSEAVFEEVYDRVERCVAELAALLNEEAEPAP